MIDILLTIIILSILGYHGWYVNEVNKEKKSLVDALIAKSAEELKDLRIAENTKIKIEPKRQGELPDLIPIESVDDEQFLEAAENTYGNK